MKRIEVRFSLVVVAPLLDLLRPCVERLQGEVARPLHLDNLDQEMADLWTHDLIRQQKDDLETFLGLFGEDFIENGKVYFSEATAEPVLRACSALRLALRDTALGDFSDEEMEQAEPASSPHLTSAQQQAFAAYLFLATIQELVIRHLLS